MTTTAPPALVLGDHTIAPGTRRRVDLPVTRLPTGVPVTVPVVVVHGARPGPRLAMSAAVHGDELNGVEVIRRVLADVDAATLRGSLLAVPFVNVIGFTQQSRYLPDRRDLNRAFPGSPRGSLAARIAHRLMTTVIAQCTHAIDLHTGSHHRTNLPQVRGNLQDPATRRIMQAFDAPVMMHARTRSGSLRAAAVRRGIPAIVYEAGEPLRFTADAIATGVAGTRRVMRALGMLRRAPRTRPGGSVEVARGRWVRARTSGLLRLDAVLGARVRRGDVLGSVGDPLGEATTPLRAPVDGIVIGHSTNPLVHPGDALVHVGQPAE